MPPPNTLTPERVPEDPTRGPSWGMAAQRAAEWLKACTTGVRSAHPGPTWETQPGSPPKHIVMNQRARAFPGVGPGRLLEEYLPLRRQGRRHHVFH